MTTQREKDKGAAWTQTDMSADPREVFADGAAYARKEILRRMVELSNTTYEADILDVLAEELQKS